MRYATMAMALLLTACGAGEEGPATKALAAYNTCLDKRGVEGCQTEKAKLDAAIAYANAQSNRVNAMNAGSPPLVMGAYTPPQTRRGITCTTTGPITTCD